MGRWLHVGMALVASIASAEPRDRVVIELELHGAPGAALLEEITTHQLPVVFRIDRGDANADAYVAAIEEALPLADFELDDRCRGAACRSAQRGSNRLASMPALYRRLVRARGGVVRFVVTKDTAAALSKLAQLFAADVCRRGAAALLVAFPSSGLRAEERAVLAERTKSTYCPGTSSSPRRRPIPWSKDSAECVERPRDGRCSEPP